MNKMAVDAKAMDETYKRALGLKKEVKMPWPIRRSFRTKAVGLAAMQSTVVCCTTMAIDFVLNREQHKFIGWAMIGFGVIAAFVTLPLGWHWRNQFPKNYLICAVLSFLMGLYWAGMDFVIFKDSYNICAQSLF